MKKWISATAFSAMLLPMLLATACGSDSDADAIGNDDDPVVVEIGDTCLRLQQVLSHIPVGMQPADSAALFERIVSAWSQRILLRDFAMENIDDLDRIDRMVEDYRTRLIVASYKRSMRENATIRISEDSVKRHYRNNPEVYRLERPLVKGIFIRLPANSTSLDNVRRWIASGTSEGIDRLERDGLRDALQYSFFEDQWIDFQTLADRIPYRFYDQNAFVESQKDFETTYHGSTYLLHISSFIPAGSPMPYEYAAPIIRESLETAAAADYEKRLVKSVVDRARRDGRLKRHRIPSAKQ